MDWKYGYVRVKNISDPKVAVTFYGYTVLPGQLVQVPESIWIGKGVWRKYQGKLKSYLRSEMPTETANDIADYVIAAAVGNTSAGTSREADDGLTYTFKNIGTADCPLYAVIDTNTHVTGVTLNKTTTTITAGGNETLTATVAPSGATNTDVTWKSNKTSVATVNSSGKVTAVAAGTAKITVTTVDGKKTATCTVTVEAAGG